MPNTFSIMHPIIIMATAKMPQPFSFSPKRNQEMRTDATMPTPLQVAYARLRFRSFSARENEKKQMK